MKRLMFVLMAIALVFAVAWHPTPNTQPLYISHTVFPGDTLWSICKGYADYYGDRRSYEEIIYYTRQQNKVDVGNMQPGDVLVIELLVERGEQLEKE